MKKIIVNSLLIGVIAIVGTGCFGPANSSEDVVKTYIKSMQDGNFKIASSVSNDELKKQLDIHKKECYKSDKEMDIALGIKTKQFTKEQEVCIKKMNSKDAQTYGKENTKYINEENIEKLEKNLKKCSNDDAMVKFIANLYPTLVLYGQAKGKNIYANYAEEILDKKTLQKCKKSAISLWGEEGNSSFSKAIISKITDKNDAQKILTVDFIFDKYKQEANFMTELKDDKWSIVSIDLNLELKMNSEKKEKKALKDSDYDRAVNLINKNRRSKKAIELFLPFAANGDVQAQSILGRFYVIDYDSEKKNCTLAGHWLTKAYKQGDSDAKQSLEYFYRSGECIKPNNTKANELGSAYKFMFK